MHLDCFLCNKHTFDLWHRSMVLPLDAPSCQYMPNNCAELFKNPSMLKWSTVCMHIIISAANATLTLEIGSWFFCMTFHLDMPNTCAKLFYNPSNGMHKKSTAWTGKHACKHWNCTIIRLDLWDRGLILSWDTLSRYAKHLHKHTNSLKKSFHA